MENILNKFRLNIILTVTLFVAAILVSGQVVLAQGSGAIWTTTVSCGTPQNSNHYVTGATVFINGENFDPGVYTWEIKGQPGGASNHPNEVMASGTVTVDEKGTFCFGAYTIGPEDGGTYRVLVGNKNDNYRVEQISQPTQEPTPIPTEEPTPVPTEEPIPVPTEEPTPVPTEEPIPVPTEEPIPVPTEEPIPVPTEEPIPVPTEEPIPVPTEEPIPVPTEEPTPVPTEEPTPVPTQDPEGEPPPTIAQSTPAPVIAPTTGAASGPTTLIATAASSLGLSGLSLGVWLKRRKS